MPPNTTLACNARTFLNFFEKRSQVRSGPPSGMSWEHQTTIICYHVSQKWPLFAVAQSWTQRPCLSHNQLALLVCLHHTHAQPMLRPTAVVRRLSCRAWLPFSARTRGTRRNTKVVRPTPRIVHPGPHRAPEIQPSVKSVTCLRAPSHIYVG